MIAKLIFWSFATPFDITIFWSQIMINLYLWHRCFLSDWTNLDTLHPLWHWLAAGQELSVADGVGPISLCTLWSILFGPGQPSSLWLCRLTKFIRKVKERKLQKLKCPTPDKLIKEEKLKSVYSFMLEYSKITVCLIELVSNELNHFGVIADLFRQIGGHSNRFVLFCSFWRLFSINMIKNVFCQIEPIWILYIHCAHWLAAGQAKQPMYTVAAVVYSVRSWTAIPVCVCVAWPSSSGK